MNAKASAERRVKNLWDRRKEKAGWWFRKNLKINGSIEQIRFAIASGEATKGAAESIRDQIIADLKSKSDPIDVIRRHGFIRRANGKLNSPAANGIYTIGQASRDYLEFHKTETVSDKQKKDVVSQLGIVVSFLGADQPLSELTSEQAIRLKNALLEGYQGRRDTRSTRSAGKIMGVLRACVEYARDSQHECPMGRRPVKTVQSERRDVKVDWGLIRDVLAIAEAEDPELHLWLLMLRDSGCRPRELHTMRWADAKIRPRGAKAGLCVDFKRLPETNKIKHRGIRFTSPDVLEAFKRLRNGGGSGPVFSGRLDAYGARVGALTERVGHKRRKGAEALTEAFRGVGDFRHEIVQTMAINGVATAKAMLITGHRSAQVHLGYAGKDFSRGTRPALEVDLEWSN